MSNLELLAILGFILGWLSIFVMVLIQITYFNYKKLENKYETEKERDEE